MAYNPFDFFRRNQKILFAVLTVFIMIMFTLSWGGNDFFNWFPRWLGSRSSGDVMAVVDGRKVRSSDLYAARQERAAANKFMLAAAVIAEGKLAKELSDTKAKVSDANRPLVERFVRDRQPSQLARGARYVSQDLLMQALSSGQFNFQNPGELDRLVERIQFQTISQYRRDLGQVATANNPKPDDQSAAEVASKLLALDLALGRRGGLYFAESPNETDKDVLNFLLWKKKADQLGVRFTREDVVALVEDEFGALDKEDLGRALGSALSERRGQSANAVYDAVADEFRVRAAQRAVLGAAAQGAGGVPTSPDQSFARFKELADPGRWSVIPVRTDAFLAQVQGIPSPTEVTDIFRKGQNVEPDPALARPALKKPRELKVGWLELTAKEEYYKAAAAEAMRQAEPAADLGHLLVVPFGGGGFAQVAGVGVAAVPDKLVLGEYTKYKNAEERKGAFGPPPPADAFRPQRSETTDAALSRPDNVAAMIGAAAAAPLTAGLPAQLRAERIDLSHRIGVQMLPLAPALAGPAGFGPATLTDLAPFSNFREEVAPKPLPVAALRDVMAERVKANLRDQKLPEGDLTKLQADTEKAVKDHPDDKMKGRAAAKEIVDKFVALRKLKELNQVGGSAAFADVHSVGRDAGLARLKDRLAGPHPMPGVLDNFGRVFFKDAGPTGREVDSQRFFQPRPYPESDVGTLAQQSQYMVWLTDEVEAAAPRRADEVTDKITAEWRRQKARALAKAAAEKVVADLAAKSPSAGTVNQLLAELARPLQELPTPLPPMAERQILSAGGYRLTDYPWPDDTIKYPTEAMVRTLRENRHKPVGTAFVLADQPEGTHFVAVVTGRDERSQVEFGNMVFGPEVPAERNPAGRMLGLEIAGRTRQAALDDALDLLRSEFGYADENPKVNDKRNAND